MRQTATEGLVEGMCVIRISQRMQPFRFEVIVWWHTWLDDKCTHRYSSTSSMKRPRRESTSGNFECVLFHSSPLAFIITLHSIHSRKSEWKRLARHEARMRNRQQVKWMTTIEGIFSTHTARTQSSFIIISQYRAWHFCRSEGWRCWLRAPKQTHSDEWMESHVRNLPDSSSIKSEMARLNR